MNGIGTLIRQLRMERGYSQAGLSKGVCVPSYLSKIEQGQGDPSPEIVEKLFAALGVTYCRDRQLIAKAREKWEEYTYAWLRSGDLDEPAAWLDDHRAQLDCSELHLDLCLYDGMQAGLRRDVPAMEAVCRRLSPEKPQMTQAQRALLAWLEASCAGSRQETLEKVEEAYGHQPMAICQSVIANLLFDMGRYSKGVEAATLAYQMAAEEGDLRVLIDASVNLGNCYTEVNLELAEKYYSRAVRLAGKDGTAKYSAWYNLGASHLERGELEAARYWLEKDLYYEGNPFHNLSLSQKRVILYGQLGEPELARTALSQAREALAQLDPKWELCPLCEKMVEIAALRLEPDYLQNPAYEQVLTQFYRQTEDKLGHGYQRFFGRLLVELYRSQRRYKEALQVTETIERINSWK